MTNFYDTTGEGGSGEPGFDELPGDIGGESERRRTEEAVHRHRNGDEPVRFATGRADQWAR